MNWKHFMVGNIVEKLREVEELIEYYFSWGAGLNYKVFAGQKCNSLDQPRNIE